MAVRPWFGSAPAVGHGNVTQWGNRIEEWLDQGDAQQTALPGHVVFFQEHRLGHAALLQVRSRLQKKGWSFFFAAAPKDQGEAQQVRANQLSGGTAIAIRRHLPANELVRLENGTIGPLAGVRWNAVELLVRGGRLLLVSLYAVVSEAMGPQNAALLAEVGAMVRARRTESIIAADWQITPGELQYSGWVSQIGGRILSTADQRPFARAGRPRAGLRSCLPGGRCRRAMPA